MKALKVGGLIYIQTHQSFPLHGYPHDYFRFSREALASLFGTHDGHGGRGHQLRLPDPASTAAACPGSRRARPS